jgi:basic membrane protein A
MLKRLDVAAYQALEEVAAGSWQAGTERLGLAEDGVGWSLDADNQALVTPAMRAAVDEAAKAIAAGRLVVHDYRSDGACPVE